MIIHPHPDSEGNLVPITFPHTASGEHTWHDPNAMATFTPGGKAPDVYKRNLDSIKAHTPLIEAPFKGDRYLRPAAGIIGVEPDKRVWLVSPTNGFGGYKYTFPKGKVDQGEDFQRAATRETHEETGLHMHPYHHLGDYERSTSVARMYLGKTHGGSPSDMGWESQAVHLVPMKDLHSYVHTYVDHQIVNDLHRHFAKRRAMDILDKQYGG